MAVTGDRVTLTCHGCGDDFYWIVKPARYPKWCSERCRKSQYAATCSNCGRKDNGSEGGRDGDWLCGDCKHDEAYAERNARIFELWDAGLTGNEIGPEVGMAPGSVQSLVHFHRVRGEPLLRHRRSNRDLWPEIRRLWNEEGLTAREIGERLGTNKENVDRMIAVMRECGLDVARRGYDWARRAA